MLIRFTLRSTVRDGEMVVTLNVGGTRFMTTMSTMQLQRDTYFDGLVRTAQHVEDHEHFVDRDPSHFRHVLNFMRGTPSLPATTHEVDELSREADFYGMPALVRYIEEHREQAERPITHYLDRIANAMG